MQDFVQKIRERYPYLPNDKLEHLLGLGQMVMLNPGNVFIEAGTRSTKAAFVIQGLLRNYIINEKGEQVTVVFATQMQALTSYTCVFLNRPATETTEAVEESTLLVFDFIEIKKLAATDILYSRVYTDFIERAFVDSIERVEDFTNRNPEQRYLRLLETQGHLIEQAPLKYLASYLGVTPVSLSRIRKRLSKKRN